MRAVCRTVSAAVSRLVVGLVISRRVSTTPTIRLTNLTTNPPTEGETLCLK